MTEQKLVLRLKGFASRQATYHDKVLEDAGNITIDQDDYTAVLDRVYDVKGLANLHVEIVNTGTTNGLEYRIEKARKEFIAIANLVDADFNEEVKADTIVSPGVAAFGTITLATVLAGDTVTINGLVYTAVAGVKADNTEFSIDGTDTVDAADLADSITNDTRVGTLDDVTATSAVAVVTATQTVAGTPGNATTLVSSNGARLAVSGATFTGGVEDDSISDVIDLSPETTAIRIRIRRETAGQSTTLTGIVSAN